jgi:DHA2 family multidrug resistance protein
MWEAFPAERKGVATAIFGMGVMIGPSLGLVAGGYITDNLSWPWIFYINVPFGILAALLTWFFVPNGERPRTIARVDLLGAAFLAIGMGALQTVLERGQEEDWFDSRLIVWLTVAAVLGLCSFVWWELSVHDPIVDLRVFRDRSLAVGTVFSFVVGIGLYATIFLLPLYLQSLQGNTAFETGMTMLPGTVASIFAFMLAGPLAQKVDPRWLLPIGVATFMMGTGMLGGLTTQAGTGDVIVPLILRGISLGFLFIPLNVAAIGSLPDGATDTAIDTGAGLINLARQLGGSIGIATFSTLLVRRQYFHRAVLVQHLDTGSVTVGTWLAGARSYLVQHGMCAASAHSVALFQMAQSVERQAYMLAFNDVFLCISATFLTCVPMILLFRKREVRHVPT